MSISKDPFTPAQEKAFIKWIQQKPSCLSGDTHNVVCAHVRRVSEGAGTGRKPRLFAVALTQDEHAHQHQHGELEAFRKYGKPSYAKNLSDDAIKAWYSYRALQNRAEFLARGKK